MARWLINQNESQSSVGSLAELCELAASGRLSGGDMVQPPGASDWLYASEIPELSGILKARTTDDEDDFSYKKSGASTTIKVGFLLVMLAIGSAAMWHYSTLLPAGNERLIGDGGLSYSQMLVTGENVVLRVDPEPASRALVGVKKDQALDLLAKRGDFYRARNEDGVEGWIAYDEVIPMYLLGGGDVVDDFDPLYNPDRYAFVLVASWLQLPEQADKNVTVFQFRMRNESKYDMTDLRMQATIKDAKGTELEKIEILVDGIIPKNSDSAVGTLGPPDDADDDEEHQFITYYTLEEMADTEPDLYFRYTDGVEVLMNTSEFTEASIDILELRAIPED